MKYLFTAMACLFIFFVSAQSKQTVFTKAKKYFDIIGTGVTYSVYESGLDTTKVDIVFMLDSAVYSTVDSMTEFSNAASLIISDYAIYDSGDAYSAIKVNYCLNKKDTLGFGLYVMPGRVAACKKKQEVFTVKQKCDLIAATAFLPHSEMFMHKDTIVFVRGGYGMKEYADKIGEGLDKLAEFVQDYVLRGKKNKWVRYDLYDENGYVYAYLYNQNGRVYYKTFRINLKKEDIISGR